MALGPFVFDFPTSCSVLRSCAYVHAIALRLALLLQEYFNRVRGLFLTAIAVNRRYAFRDCAFRCVSTMYARGYMATESLSVPFAGGNLAGERQIDAFLNSTPEE